MSRRIKLATRNALSLALQNETRPEELTIYQACLLWARIAVMEAEYWK